MRSPLYPIAACLLLLSALPVCAASAGNDAATIAKLHVLEDQFATAAGKGDVFWLDTHLTRDYVGIESVGRVINKADVLQEAKEQAASKDLAASSAVNDSLTIRVYDGNFAVATGKATITSKEAGHVQTIHLLFTDVWLQQKGVWKVVSTQGTHIPPA